MSKLTDKISQNFYWDEVTHSETAERLGIDNTLPIELKLIAQNTANKMERVRALLDNNSIQVTSWYRCLPLNRALKSGDSSQHLKAEAVDFKCRRFGTPLQICKKILTVPELIVFDQLILEHTWVHISFTSNPASKPRRQVLSLLKSGKCGPGLTDLNGNPL